VRRFALKIDPMATDPWRWGHSLSNLAELWIPVLDAAAPQSVIEIGAYAGDVTRLLLEWAQDSGARIVSIDPDPQPELIALADEHSGLELVRAPSHEALLRLERGDAVIIDGDHNYYTVSEELRLIASRAGSSFPLVICHDVCWPHARRDSYYNPAAIPAADRRETVDGGYLYPGVSGLHSGGLPYKSPAVREGGPRNGVLTAIEDFLSGREDLHCAIVPAFFGVALIWPHSAPWGNTVAAALEPYAANPILDRLEANRVLHLASRVLEAVRAGQAEERNVRKDEFLHKLLESKTFSVAVWLSRLRQRGGPAFSKDEVRELLSD
jgi:SAM-dependent methyltransferase